MMSPKHYLHDYYHNRTYKKEYKWKIFVQLKTRLKTIT